ncbi:MAG: hypothetical protein R3339_09405, partial [Thermodesulfobacteriota bacterium]|nr:hypothetical protein [Thermodesulfobacteriota bacterium]
MKAISSRFKRASLVRKESSEASHHYNYCGEGIHQLIESYSSDESPFITANDLTFPEIESDSGIVRELKSVFFPRYWNRGNDYDPSRKELLEFQLNNVGTLLYEDIKTYLRAYSLDRGEITSNEDIEQKAKAAVDTLFDRLGSIRDKL